MLYAGSETSHQRLPSDYLRDDQWVEAWKSSVKGYDVLPVDDDMAARADKLLLALGPYLDYHIAKRVHPSRQSHWTLAYARSNLPPMAAGMCLSGHVVDDIDCFGSNECMLQRQLAGFFQFVDRHLLELEGCYLYWDRVKHKLIRSGKTSGEGVDACFRGRGIQHKKNSASKDEMREHPLYAK